MVDRDILGNSNEGRKALPVKSRREVSEEGELGEGWSACPEW